MGIFVPTPWQSGLVISFSSNLYRIKQPAEAGFFIEVAHPGCVFAEIGLGYINS